MPAILAKLNSFIIKSSTINKFQGKPNLAKLFRIKGKFILFNFKNKISGKFL